VIAEDDERSAAFFADDLDRRRLIGQKEREVTHARQLSSVRCGAD